MKQLNKEKDLNFLLNKYNININDFIISDIGFYNRDNVLDNDNLFDLICPICLNILNNPICCSLNKNSHFFCNQCINKYLKDNNKCPICKNIFEFKINEEIYNTLSNLLFKCVFYKEGCKDIISYSDYFDHIYNCKFKTNITYECQINRYNYLNKNFEKCMFRGNKEEIENHFKSCAFLKYKCIFCKVDILQINLQDHVENICKIGIINYSQGEKYIGEKENNQINGYGIYYYTEGNRYEGEWKQGHREGYGTYFYSTGDKYEGE